MSRLAQEQDTFTCSHKSLPVFKQHLLVHLEELSQARQKDVVWVSTIIRRNSQNNTESLLRQTCMDHIHAMSRGKNNSSIKLKVVGVLLTRALLAL